MNIAFITSDISDFRDPNGFPFLGGAAWYRLHLPSHYLWSLGGHRTGVMSATIPGPRGRFHILDWHGSTHKDYDLVVCNNAIGTDVWQPIEKARDAGQAVVMDVDDLYWQLHEDHPQKANIHPDSLADKEKIWAACSAITVSTPLLWQLIHPYNPHTYLIRNAIEINRFERNPVRTRKPTVGWTGSLGFRSGDLETLKGILEPFILNHDLKFMHCGKIEGEERDVSRIFSLPEDSIVRRPLVAMEMGYTENFGHFDIGIVPLSRHSFNEAKSALKGMEYSAAGIPFVAQLTGEYLNFGQGIIAATKKEWYEGLERLLDPGERYKLANAAYERVLKEDIAVRWREWEAVYRIAMEQQ